MTAPKKARIRKCHDGKKRFESLIEAKAAITQMCKRKMKQGNPIVSHMRAYGCACGGFHIGSTRDINWDLVAELTSTSRAGA